MLSQCRMSVQTAIQYSIYTAIQVLEYVNFFSNILEIF